MSLDIDFAMQGSRLFYSANLTIELVMIAISLIVAYVSYKAYKFSRKKGYYYFFTAFMLSALAYLVRTSDNIFYFLNIHVQKPTYKIIYITYMFLMLASYSTLALSFMEIKSKRDILFVLSLALLLSIASIKTVGIFYAGLALIMFFVNIHFFDNFSNKKNMETFMMFTAFFLFLIAQILALIFKTNHLGKFNNLSFSIIELIKFVADGIIIMIISKIFLLKNKKTKISKR